jgi:hypothetical protein
LRIPWFRTIALGGYLLAAVLATAALAGPPMETPRRAATESTQPAAENGVKEAQPPVLFLRNKDGGLMQAVLGFTLEDFERFMKQRAQLGLGQQPPRYQLDRLVARAQAGDRHVDLTIDLTVGVNQPGWVRIPLRMAEAVMRGKPRHQGPGEFRIEFDPAAKEHVLWLRGEGDDSHHLTLEVAAPLEKLPEQTEFKLGLPRAAVAELTLTVPEANATATVREGGLLDSTTPAKTGTEFKVLGMERDFAIAWHKENAAATEVASPLDASGILVTRIDPAGIHTDVQLTVRTFASKLDTFRLRIPANARLTGAGQAGYQIEPVPPSDKPGEDRWQLFEVRLRDKATAPSVIRFSLDQPLDEQSGERGFQLTGVELVGAARQSGFVIVKVADGWQANWGELRQARQVDDVPAGLDRDGVLASFEYFGKPFSIAGHLIPLKTHLSVEPSYSVEVDSRQVRLEARLVYQVRGAKAFALQVGLAGWELDDVAPRATFDVDRVAVETDKPLRIPLLQPTTGEVELILRCHRDLAPDTTQVEFDLPRAMADSVAPAQVMVTPAADVALEVREKDVIGLSRVRGDVPAAANDGERDAIAFRGTSGELRFAADLHVESRSVAAEVRSQLTIDEKETAVEEVINYTIGNEPLGELLFDVPNWGVGAEQMQWELDGQPVVPTTDDREAGIERTVRFRLPLAEKKQGKCRLLVRYPLHIAPLVAGQETPLDVPLVMPAVTELAANELSVVPAGHVKVEQRENAWNVEPHKAETSSATVLRLTNPLPSTEVALVATLDESRSVEPLIVKRAWIQTRLADGERWDRAVFEIAGGDKQVTLRLPPGAIATEAQLIVDRSVAKPQSLSRDSLTVNLVPGSDEHVIDVSYRFATRFAEVGRLQVVLPEIEGAPWVRQSYWQLVVPRDKHLIDWPAQLSGAFAWQFDRGVWARHPLVEQQDLENWTHTSAGPGVPDQTNRYVLTAVGPLGALDVRLASRTALVAGAAGGVLLLGLLLLNFPVLRHPAALFVAGVLLMVTALLLPDLALVVAQVAAVGVCLVLLAAALERYLHSRRRSPLVIRTTPSSVLEPGSTRTHLRVQASSSSGEALPRVPQVTAPSGDT